MTVRRTDGYDITGELQEGKSEVRKVRYRERSDTRRRWRSNSEKKGFYQSFEVLRFRVESSTELS